MSRAMSGMRGKETHNNQVLQTWKTKGIKHLKCKRQGDLW